MNGLRDLAAEEASVLEDFVQDSSSCVEQSLVVVSVEVNAVVEEERSAALAMFEVVVRDTDKDEGTDGKNARDLQMDFVSRVAIMILFNLIIIYFQVISVGTFGLLQYVVCISVVQF